MKEEYPPTIVAADVELPIPYEIRDQHIFVPGMTRHGKSTLLLNLIMTDIENGAGVAVLDPKGSLVRWICSLMPPERYDDCIYLDLKDPVPLDVMRGAANPESLVGDLKQLVLKGETTLKRAEPILTRLIYSLLKIPDSRFTDIEEFFTDPTRKHEIMNALKIHAPDRHAYWTANPVKPDEYSSLVNRMTDFTQNESLYTILGEPSPALNIAKAMNERKIILVNLGGSGEPREIYGSLLVSRIQQAAFMRTDLKQNDIIPFHLHVDEFENFQTTSFAKILSVAGGLGLRLTVGNQYIHQLSEDIRHAIFGNVGTYIIFHVKEGLDLFKNIVAPYDVNRLAQLPKYQAVCKIANRDYPIFKWMPSPLNFDEEYGDKIVSFLKSNTLREYGPKRQKRSGDDASCNSAPVRHDEVNGSPSTNAEPYGRDIPDIPPDQNKKRNRRPRR